MNPASDITRVVFLVLFIAVLLTGEAPFPGAAPI